MFIPFMHPCLMRVDVLLGWSLTKKYQVVSVLPSVAPSAIRVLSRCAMSHGYDRLVAYEAGANGSHSKNAWLSWSFRQDGLELGTRPSKDEQESHRDVIGKLAYRLEFRHQWCYINGGYSQLGSWITKNQLWGILILVGAHFKLVIK